MPKGLISKNFNKGVKCFWSCLSLAGIPGINPHVFPALTRERGHFLVLFIFWITVSAKMFKQIQADLLGGTRGATKQMYQVSLKYIQPDY